MGVWAVGQCDLHPPAATAAQSAFNTTFPTEQKRSDVLAFCRAEVFAYLKDNLFEQTAKSLSEPNSVSEEEMESKYILVVTATLQALKLFLSSLQPKEHESVQEEYSSIIANSKFWKLAKHKEPQIRGSWFSLLSCVCSVLPALLSGQEQRVASTVFSCLSEPHPVVATAAWEAALAIVLHLQNCWSGVDASKVVLPPLWSLLKAGGGGNARVLYPCLLPFLSRLPPQVAEDEAFLHKMFATFRESLHLDSVAQSPSECDAILSAFFECLQYMGCVRMESSQLLKHVLVNEVIPLIECSLFDARGSHLALSSLYPLASGLLHKLEDTPLAAFWEALMPLTHRWVGMPAKEQEKCLPYVCYLFNCLTHQQASKKKKKTVRFQESEDGEAETEPKEEQTSSEMACRGSVSFEYLASLVRSLCNQEDEGVNLCHVRLLEELLSPHLLEEVAEGEPFAFFRNTLLPWLEEQETLPALFRLIFVICSHIQPEEAGKILSFCAKTNVLLLEQVLEKGLGSREPFFVRWLEECRPTWSGEVVKGLEELVRGKRFFLDASAALPIEVLHRIITMCIKEGLLDEASVDRILRQLLALTEQMVAMADHHDLALDFIHGLTLDICCVEIEIFQKSVAATELVSTLFKTSLLDVLRFKNSAEVCSMLKEITNRSIIGEPSRYLHHKHHLKYKEPTVWVADGLIRRMSEELIPAILALETPEQASHLLKQSMHFLTCVNEVQRKDEVAELISRVLPSDTFWNSLKGGMDIDVLLWFLKGKQFYPMLRVAPSDNTTEQTQKKFSLVCEVVSGILSQNLFDQSPEAPFDTFLFLEIINGPFPRKSQDIPKPKQLPKEDTTFSQCIENQLPYLLWFLTFRNQQDSSSKLKENCLELISFLSESHRQNLFHSIFNMSLSDMQWSLCFQYLGDICDVEISPMLLTRESTNEKEPFVHRGLSQFLPNEVKTKYAHSLLLEILDAEDIQNEDCLVKMGELCACLKGSQLTEHSTSLLQKVYLKVIQHDFQLPENAVNMHHMLLVSILSLLVDHKVDFFSKEILDFLKDLIFTLSKSWCKATNEEGRLLLLNQACVLFSSLFQMNCGNTELFALLADRDLHYNMVDLFQNVADVYGKEEEKCGGASARIVLGHLLECVEHVLPECMLNAMASEEAKIKAVVSALTSSSRPLQFAAHSMLNSVMPLLPKLVDEEINKQIQSVDEEEIKTPSELSPLIDLLVFLSEIVEGVLEGMKVGGCVCTVLPNTDSHLYTCAYLLAWIQLFTFLQHSPTQMCLGYALYLEEKLKLLSSLFSNVLRLMPENPSDLCSDTRQLFLQPPTLQPDGASSEEIQRIACYVYTLALRRVPAIIRTWFNNLDWKVADSVSSFTSKHISGLLISEEMQAVVSNEKLFENLAVHARVASREVVATYTVDEYKMELCVQLPPNHPLGAIAAERRGRTLIGPHEWRHWLMQLNTVLAQSGSIVDGLRMWHRNLEKKFEGVEECMICYYILHASTLKLPHLRCHVCRKKFHSACLYKWFRTSNNSTCPLCRNEFHL